MPQTPDWSRYLDAGAQFVALTRTEARRRARELVATGQLAQNQAQAFVDDLVDTSRRRTDELRDVVRKEIQRQVKTLGIATKDDLARLETRLAKPASGKGGGGSTSGKRSVKKAAKKPAAKKAKKPAAKKAEKPSAKKAKKPSAKRAGAKRSAKRSAKQQPAAPAAVAS